ncbi:diacylglycerol/lipid kinase family protein [Maricaulis parjimensis]|uniref:diacylglycerol/lipid kinase family protein n=1 Tax=Maricaulis parjimensis TaxID=144023 RepID=UPI0019394A27|nr:diacylglycerol kinase family protein [Maricaulis parjimensis]
MADRKPGERLALVVNTSSGRFVRGGADEVADAVQSHNRITEVWPLDDFNADRLAAGWESGIGGIAIAGGDGTIRSVAQHVYRHRPDCPLLPLPFGTANLLVKRVYGDRDPIDLLDHICEGPMREFRPGLLNDSVFLVAAGLGFPSTIARARERLREFEGPPPLPSFSKRVAASIRQAFTPGIRYTTNDGNRRHRASGVYVDLADLDAHSMRYIAVHWREMGDIARTGWTLLSDPDRLPTGEIERLEALARKPLAAMIDGEPVFTENAVKLSRARTPLQLIPVSS